MRRTNYQFRKYNTKKLQVVRHRRRQHEATNWVRQRHRQVSKETKTRTFVSCTRSDEIRGMYFTLYTYLGK